MPKCTDGTGNTSWSTSGSTNGTMVNESTITEHTLRPGDRITIGRSVLEFRRA